MQKLKDGNEVLLGDITVDGTVDTTKCGEYPVVTQVTVKSPKIYRFTYVDRMMHLGIDALPLLFEANEIQITAVNWQKSGDLQRQAISKLQTLSYLAMISQEGELNILTTKKYLQISQGVDDCIEFVQILMRQEFLSL